MGKKLVSNSTHPWPSWSWSAWGQIALVEPHRTSMVGQSSSPARTLPPVPSTSYSRSYNDLLDRFSMTGWLISWRPDASQLILLMLLQGVASVPKGSDAPANPSGLRILLQPKMEIGCSYHVLWLFMSCSFQWWKLEMNNMDYLWIFDKVWDLVAMAHGRMLVEFCPI